MDFKTKRQAKRLGKLFTRLAISFMVLMFSSIVSMIVLVNIYDKPADKILHLPMWVVLTLTIGNLFPMIICYGFSGYYLGMRSAYKRSIREFRQRLYFKKAGIAIMEGNIDKASNIYHNLMKDNFYRNIIYTMVVMYKFCSLDINNKKDGEERLDDIFKKYAPEKAFN